MSEKEVIRRLSAQQVERACGMFESVQKLANKLDVSTRTVYRWKNGEVIISAENAQRIAAMTGISIDKIRPDLWGNLPDSMKNVSRN